MLIDTDELCKTLHLVRMYVILDRETIHQQLLNVSEAQQLHDEGRGDHDLLRLQQSMLRVSREVAAAEVQRHTPHTARQRYRLWRLSQQQKSARQTILTTQQGRASETLAQFQQRVSVHPLPAQVQVADHPMTAMKDGLFKVDMSSWFATGECRVIPIQFTGASVRHSDDPNDPCTNLVYTYDDGSLILLDAHDALDDEVPSGCQTQRLFTSQARAIAAIQARLADTHVHLPDGQSYECANGQSTRWDDASTPASAAMKFITQEGH
jgi:hypothetical protein